MVATTNVKTNSQQAKANNDTNPGKKFDALNRSCLSVRNFVLFIIIAQIFFFVCLAIPLYYRSAV